MRVALALLIWFSAASCLAQSIHHYKSVHGDGTVSYSDTRPADDQSVTEVNVYQGSATSEQQGAERMRELDATIKAIDKKNAEEAAARRKYQGRLSEAREEVGDAQRFLVTTQQSKKHATPERIDEAENRLRLANQRLREVERAGP
jgi:hypothetical protein